MKLLKNLFTVPAGEKVTERHFKRVLISSVCGILLCMTCLVSTTWAWFTATLETGAITIQVANTYVDVTVDGGNTTNGESSIALSAGQTAAVELTFCTDASASTLNPTPSRYIVLSVYDADNSPEGSYFVAVDSNSNKCTLTLSTDAPCTVFFTPAWQPLLVEDSELESGDSVVLIDLPDATTAPTTEPKDDKTDTGDGQTDTEDGKTDTGDGETDTGDGQTDTGDGETDTGDGQTDAGDGETDTGDGKTDTGDGQTDIGDGQTDGEQTGGEDQTDTDEGPSQERSQVTE